MRVRKRRFAGGLPEHIYIRGVRKQVLFFDTIDRLAYYTRYAVMVKKKRVRTLALSIMYDHLHSLSIFDEAIEMSDLIRDHLSCFARDYNMDAGRTGPLFECAYGSAPKGDVKKTRSAIIYIGNNHVEKKLCEKAEECRWSFVAYLNSDHPYSEKLDRNRMSHRLKLSLSCVDSCCKAGIPLSFHALRTYYDGLTEKEAEQLTDYIITSYFPIDRQQVLSYFNGDYQTFLTALHSTTGNDFDIREDYSVNSHKGIERMIILCEKSSFRGNIKRIQTQTKDQKCKIACILEGKTTASAFEIKKLLDGYG